MKSKLIKIILAFIVLLVIALIVTAMSLGAIIKKGVETAGPRLTQTEVRLNSATVSLLSGSGSIHGFLLGNPKGYNSEFAIKIRKVDLGVKPKSLFSDKVHITRLVVEAPEIIFEGTPNNNNLTKIRDNVRSASGNTSKNPPPGEGKGEARKLQVDDLLITGGRIRLSTMITGGKEVVVTLPDIHYPNLGQGPEGVTVAELSKRVLDDVTKETLIAVTQVLTELGKGVVDAASGAVRGATENAGKAATDLLKDSSNTLRGLGGLPKKN